MHGTSLHAVSDNHAQHQPTCSTRQHLVPAYMQYQTTMHSTSLHAVPDNHDVSKLAHSFTGTKKNAPSKQIYSIGT